MFTQQNRLLHVLLALVVLATSLAWTPMDGHAKDGAGDPPIPPELSCRGINPNRYAGDGWYYGCGKGWVEWRPVLRPRITLLVNRNLLFVNGERMRRLHTYNVRIRKGSGEWTNLRPVRSTRVGTVNQVYRLPDSYKRALRIYVCLKDIDNDRTYCGWAMRVY